MDERDRAEQDLIVRCPDPFNAETPAAKLVASFLTPQADFYIRSHGAVPRLPVDHRIVVDGLVEQPSSYTRDELRAAFSERSVISVMQCAGNRRADFQPVKETAGDPWDVGAIGNAEWTGVALRDVLDAAGVKPSARFVGFTGADEVKVENQTDAFGVSIPLAKALEPDVLIAWAMNGEPLAPEHGAPLRMVVPGYAGVRSAKWLSRIEVRSAPSEEPIQARDYKLFAPSVAKDEADWDDGLTINEMPLNAAICDPANGALLPAGAQVMRGYSIASGRAIGRVEVSVNGGTDWQQARLLRNDGALHAWTQWEAEVALAPGLHVLVVRAVDQAGQGQPGRPDDIWNFAGYLSTAWHRVTVRVS